MRKIVGALSAMLVALAIVSSCTKLNAGDSFTESVNGIEYKFTVVVSKMSYVRVAPVSGNLSGGISIPARIGHDGVRYTVTQIAENAFRGCASITSVFLPSTLSVIEKAAFQGCTALKTINTPQPLSVIGDYAFDGCSSLEDLDLEASISTLGKGCFRGCASLKGLKFPSSFTEIPDEAFAGCVGIKELVFPETILVIGSEAFAGCAAVRSLYLDRSVQRIGAGAFFGCLNIREITCLTATPPVCQTDTFDGIDPSIPVTVLMSSTDSYASAVGWNHFSNFKGTY